MSYSYILTHQVAHKQRIETIREPAGCDRSGGREVTMPRRQRLAGAALALVGGGMAELDTYDLIVVGSGGGGLR